MMETNYKPLLKVDVLHTYFQNGVCDKLRFSLTASDRSLQKRFGFLMRHQPNGFELYFNSRNEPGAMFDYISGKTGNHAFEFDIVNTDTYFSCFTELPAAWLGQLEYDSSVPLNREEQGRVILSPGFPTNDFIPRAGKIILHFNDILRLQKENGSAHFRIMFYARATQWQYYIINKSAIHFANLQISGNKDIEFGEPQKVKIQSGEEALLFSSGSALLPLSDVPKFRFNLINNVSVATGTDKRPVSKIICKGLPNPSPRQTETVSINGVKHLSSPMYVYV